MNSRCWIAVPAVLLAACTALAPDYRRPGVDLPSQWSTPAAAQPVDALWWRIFGDPLLDRLIEEAFAGNLDVRAALARVEEARALVDVAEAARAPAADARLGRDRTRSSTQTGLLPPGLPRERNNTRATLNVSYELDLWGRIANATAAARAELLASEAARDTASIALAAQVAQSWLALRALDAQIAATRAALGLREDALVLQRKRYEEGVISQLDLRQLEAEAAAARVQLPQQERARDREETALAVLVGRSPRALTEQPLQPAPIPAGLEPLPLQVPAGLPSDLLLRRPDIAEAEQRLIASNARIAVARAAYFPSIGLTGFLGAESASLANLFTGPAGIWQVAAQLVQPVFAGGRQEAELAAARAREQQLVVQYQRVVQNAFREVREAISAQTRAREGFEAESARIRALSDTASLARLRQEHGLASLLEVLDAERNLLAAQLGRIEAWRLQRAAVADLYRALGGGWTAAK